MVIRQQLLQTASGNLSPLKRILVSEGRLGKPQQIEFCLSWKNFGESRGKLEVTGGNDPIQLLHEPLGSYGSSSFPVSPLTDPLLESKVIAPSLLHLAQHKACFSRRA